MVDGNGEIAAAVAKSSEINTDVGGVAGWLVERRLDPEEFMAREDSTAHALLYHFPEETDPARLLAAAYGAGLQVGFELLMTRVQAYVEKSLDNIPDPLTPAGGAAHRGLVEFGQSILRVARGDDA